MNRTAIVVGLMLAASALIVTALAGPINPPVGPIAPTAKPLSEIEPRTAINAANTPGDATSLFKITLPGSYYLTGNITGVVGKHGIAIAASGVTLDLNGFDLAGIPAMGAFDGVSVTVSGPTNIAVINGSVRSWGDEGVDLGTMGATNCRVDNVRARGNVGAGISVGEDTVVSNCAVSNNTGSGITAGGRCAISVCTAGGNTAHGISVGFYTTLNSCVATGNGGNGFSLAGSAAVAGCSSSANSGIGIDAGFASTVSHSTTISNVGDGIRCSFGSSILDNTCRQNGNGAGDGAGIHATGFHNRIEGNNCSTADRGIDVDLAGNIIIKNTCSGNTTNWDIVAGNVCLVVQGVTGAAILGNTGGVAPGSSDPYANFSY